MKLREVKDKIHVVDGELVWEGSAHPLDEAALGEVAGWWNDAPPDLAAARYRIGSLKHDLNRARKFNGALEALDGEAGAELEASIGELRQLRRLKAHLVGDCGVTRIAAERARQESAEGWTAEHDDQHKGGAMAMAACCYAAPRKLYERQDAGAGVHFFDPWPWDRDDDKRLIGDYREIPDPQTYGLEKRLDLLAKAGALIAAEIDRLLRRDARDAADVSYCRAARDGECNWRHCPQARDGEPVATGRHCPLDTMEDEA